MLLGLALLLATASVAVFPCWHHSRRWGYIPCATVGALLVSVAMVAAVGRPAASTEMTIAKAPPPRPAIGDDRAFRQTRQRLLLQRESSVAEITAQTSLD